MPNLITHNIFCEEVLKDINNKKYRDIITSHMEEYRIGSNGPDFLFFHGVFPLYKTPDVHISKIGTKLHRGKVNAFYKSAIETYLNYPNNKIKKAMASYIIGHYLHWQLDSVMHPYVVYNTGFKSEYATLYHHRFESMMDTINLKNYRNTTIRSFKTYEITNRGKYTDRAIAEVYIPAVYACFSTEITSDEIIQALRDWQKAQKYLYDPHKMKYRLLRSYERIARKPGLSGNVVLPDIDTRYDVMNVKKRTWLHPTTGQPSNESEDEVFIRAMNDAKIGLPLLFDALDGKDMKPFLKFLGDKTYNNGVKPSEATRLYKDPIYDRK
ncbi:zinc dependent phospholipase C [Breznakia blatticola]|uniref:Zinc dependent phospholipase C n=1 Tax=Breznakia blatticola TaxID=1754012 RepID=A0A4R7ZSQ6_9FIRM|nr:zinc dependent phospholipase C family protein [Breznakia blatticola]TDW20832.1 zinc dependent phospholipase C [Breznakia blatticola]